MQDKITIADAPDCLNTNDKAMWVLGYEAAIEARGQCLHQIQEPAAAEQAAWHAGLDEGRAQAAPAAAPVVLPEPDGFLESHPLGSIYHRGKPSQMQTFCGACPPMYEAGTVRALLATATGLPAQGVPLKLIEAINTACGGNEWQGDALAPDLLEPACRAITSLAPQAQAVPAFCHVASLKLKSLQGRGYQITGYALEKPVKGAQPERGFINHGGFVGWWWDGPSPQAQADARDDSALLDAMERQRIAVVPEYEGPWDAEVYNDEGKPNHRGTGSTPREAIRAAIAAAKVE